MRIKRFLIGISPIVLAVTGTLSCVTQPLVRPDASGAVSVDQRALERHVRMLAVTLHPRSVDNLTNLDLAADYVLEQLRATGAETAEQFVQADGKQFRNLIARFGPREGPVVVIGAHYDSCGDTPGADDNASGVAGLLELRDFGLATGTCRRTGGHTLEEPPYFRTDSMGSVWHARSLSARSARCGSCSIEMIGFYGDTADSQSYLAGAAQNAVPDKGNFMPSSRPSAISAPHVKAFFASV
jgi:hypothetical protein